MPSGRTRTRLSPSARRDQLLDHARTMIVNNGLQRFTMEGLAAIAGVSAPLVYNYFKSRSELLQTLLKREYGVFVEAITSAVSETEDFEDIVRVSVTSNFEHYAPGNVLPLLLSQPEIAVAVRKLREKHGQQVARVLVRAAARQYKLDKQYAQLMVTMSSGASIAASEFAANSGLDRDATIELAVTYIMAGIKQLTRA